MKEIIEALLYHIQVSGYATEDILRAGVVVTGGGSEIVNCANYIKELSGYSVKIGYPRRFFSCEGCPEAVEASASTSMGMIMAAKGDKMLNCIKEAPARRYWSAPKAAVPEPADGSAGSPTDYTATPSGYTSTPTDNTVPEPAEGPNIAETPEPVIEERPVEERPIEETVSAGMDDSTVFDEPTQAEIDSFRDKKKKEKTKTVKEPRQPRPKPQFKWFKHIQSSVEEMVGGIFDKMENEEV